MKNVNTWIHQTLNGEHTRLVVIRRRRIHNMELDHAHAIGEVFHGEKAVPSAVPLPLLERTFLLLDMVELVVEDGRLVVGNSISLSWMLDRKLVRYRVRVFLVGYEVCVRMSSSAWTASSNIIYLYL
jgi:hypothetical protein